MARAIKFKENYGQVLKVIPPENGKGKPKKEFVGGFKKGDVWTDCSTQLAQKLVNRLGVAEFVEAKAGDTANKKASGLAKVTEDAKAEAEKILEDAKAEAEKILEDAKAEAEKIIAEAKGKKEDLA